MGSASDIGSLLLQLGSRHTLTACCSRSLLCVQEQQGNQPVGTQTAKMPWLKAALREGIFDAVYECIQHAVQVWSCSRQSCVPCGDTIVRHPMLGDISNSMVSAQCQLLSHHWADDLAALICMCSQTRMLS